MTTIITTFKACASKSSNIANVVHKGVAECALINQKDILLKPVEPMGPHGYFVLNCVVGNDSNV